MPFKRIIDLRVGSWVKYRENYYQVFSINSLSELVGISRTTESGIESLEVKYDALNGIRFTKEILEKISGYHNRGEEFEKSNLYLITLEEETGFKDAWNPEKNMIIKWSLCIRELEGSWWVLIEDSSVTFETMGEGEFYYLHDLQNLVSTLISLDIEWNNLM